MRQRGRNEGFTLMEMLLVFFCGTMVVLMTTTLLLVGLRIHANSSRNIQRQQEIRILQALVTKLAEEDRIYGLQTWGNGDWTLVDDGGDAILCYRGEEAAVMTGDAPLVQGVTATAGFSDPVLEIRLEEGGREYILCISCPQSISVTAVP